MNLTDQQQQILGGAQGEFLAMCMRWLVEWGEATGAQRLIPVANTHALVTVPGNLVYGAGDRPLEQSMALLSSVCQHRVCGHCTTHMSRPGIRWPLFGKTTLVVDRGSITQCVCRLSSTNDVLWRGKVSRASLH